MNLSRQRLDLLRQLLVLLSELVFDSSSAFSSSVSALIEASRSCMRFEHEGSWFAGGHANTGRAALLGPGIDCDALGCPERPRARLPHEPRIGERNTSMQKRLVTRYAMRSAEAADENQRRVEGVFAELAAAKPDSVSYIVLRLADDSFVHVSFHNHGDDEVNPIASTAAFAHFQQDHADRRQGGVDQQTAQLVGAYITTID